ncbi:hypothetical protein B0A49_04360 [Cryomyces minteri]|uniref:TIP41-like protein n=1 Tax=Cryomyces minteri TaxID=331657 RepID=A0A4U0X5R6_9PEZI|nr:hypothetical protein B0A49_04360 [Cryomyces minteri]
MTSKDSITMDTTFPSPGSVPAGFVTQKGFRITTTKKPILKAGPIEEMNRRLGITVPEMIFGDNSVTIEHPASGRSISFNTFDALDRVDKTGESMLKVAYSKEWQQSRQNHHEEIKEVIKPFDWSYSTDYKGTIPPHCTFVSSTSPIPLALLRQPDPILFFDEVMLYEDELADNGIAMYSCKIRVMPDRLLLLCRFFLRLDDVIFRIRDTRIFVEFGTGEIVREYTAKEEMYKTVKQMLAVTREDVPSMMRDANKLATLMPVVDHSLERLVEA